MKNFNQLINQRITKIFLVVWPPLGEANKKDIDISLGFIFFSNPNQLFIITTNNKDRWSPILNIETIPKGNIYPFSQFEKRMEFWMSSPDDCNLQLEYYDAYQTDMFSNIENHTIRSIESICLKDSDPFGLKIKLDNDYIISSPISDGNTIETSRFHQNNNLENFEKLGEIVFKNLS